MIKSILRKIRIFIVKHYLVCTYSVAGMAFVLYLLFGQDLHFMLRVLMTLIVIFLYALIGALLYIFIKALLVDKTFDKASLFKAACGGVGLLVLYPVLKFGLEIEHLNLTYLLAPLASWPAILSVLLLNIKNKILGK